MVQMADGALRVTVNAQADGAGVGDDGSQYLFRYNQTFIQQDATTYPIQVRATDVFQLVGLGNAPSIHTGFVVTADLLQNGQFTNLSVKLVRGGAFSGCDPI
jgi:hypothetical protein